MAKSSKSNFAISTEYNLMKPMPKDALESELSESMNFALNCVNGIQIDGF
jgi:hypothetical protein